MKLSPAGWELLRKEEGVVPYVYDDQRGAKYKPTSWSDFKGYPTIAMGRLITPAEYDRFAPYLNGNKVSDALLKELIYDTVRVREDKLTALLGTAPITQAMYDALFSFMYNVGHGNKKFKAAIAALTQKDDKGKALPDYFAAAEAIATGPMTSKGKELAALVKRRATEAALFMSQGVPGGLSKLKIPLKYVALAAAGSASMVVALVLFRRRLRRRRVR